VGFFLFILVNAALFIRPSEIVEDLVYIPVYNILITSCLLVSFPFVLRELTRRRLVETPISVCVLGMQAAVLLSHLSHYNLGYTKYFGIEFLKIVLYYLLIVALLDTPARLRRFLGYLAGLIGVITLLSLLNYHGVMTIGAMSIVQREDIDTATGEVYKVFQLYGTGIFSDPNDLSLIVTMGIGLCLRELGAGRPVARGLWVVPLLVFGYTLYLTHSRGGFLAMLACVLATFLARFGWKKTIPLAAVLLPLMFVLFAGRQTDLSTSSGTGQQRVQLWAMSLAVLRQMPLFGVGSGLLTDTIGKEAHNSFVQAYAELGFFGGTWFLGMYACAFWGLRRLGRLPDQIRDPELRRMRPYLFGMAAGYATGMLSLTRVSVNPTYLVPGLIAAYLRLVAADTSLPVPLPRFDGSLVRRLVALSAACVAFLYLYVRVFARFG
jgi:O-antigen ligase